MAPQITRPVSARHAVRGSLAAKELVTVLPKRGHGPARLQVQRRNRNRRCALQKAAPCTLRLSSHQSRLSTLDPTCTSLSIEADLHLDLFSIPGAEVATHIDLPVETAKADVGKSDGAEVATCIELPVEPAKATTGVSDGAEVPTCIELPVEPANAGVDKSDGTDTGSIFSRPKELEIGGNAASATCETFLGREDRAALAASALLARVHMRLSMKGGVNAPQQPAERYQGMTDLIDEQGRKRANEDVDNDDGKKGEVLAAVDALATQAAKPRRVHFDISANVVHEIPPYAEIYGEHPRTFVFGRDSSKIAAAPGGFVSIQALSELGQDVDDDEDSVDNELEDQ